MEPINVGHLVLGQEVGQVSQTRLRQLRDRLAYFLHTVVAPSPESPDSNNTAKCHMTSPHRHRGVTEGRTKGRQRQSQSVG